MGSFFTTICMRTSKTRAEKGLRSAMKAHGFQTDNKHPEICFHLAPCGGKWYCLKSEQMDFDGFDAFAADFAAHLDAPLLTLSCADSDFILLTLHRKGETNCACIGTPYDEETPVPAREFWQDLVSDFDAFNALLSEDRVFAEEALKPLGEMMGFDGEKLLPSKDLMENATIFGFSRAGKKESPLITAGPTKLGHCNGQELQPYRLDDAYSTVVMHNYGGPSTGIEIILDAEFADSDHCIEIFDLHLRDMKSHFTLEPGQSMRAEFKCISRTGGRSSWHAVFPDFRIPEGINAYYKYPSMKLKQRTEFSQCITFNYRLRIPKHLSRLDIHFIPMEYPEGKYSWRLEDCWITPREMEIFDRQGPGVFHEYLRRKQQVSAGNPDEPE